MVKRGRSSSSSRGGTRSSQNQQVLGDIDEDKKERFHNKLQEFREERDWDKDSYEQDLKDLNNVIQTVEEIITDIQSDINHMDGTIGKSDFEDIKADYGEDRLKQLTRMGGGNYTPYLKELFDVSEQLRELEKKEKQWHIYMGLLHEIGKKKMKTVTDKYKDKYADSEVAKRYLDYIDERNDLYKEKIESQVDAKIDGKFSGLESKVEAMRNELDETKKNMRHHRRMAEKATRALIEKTDGQTDPEVEDLRQEANRMEDVNIPEYPQRKQVEEELGEEFVEDTDPDAGADDGDAGDLEHAFEKTEEEEPDPEDKTRKDFDGAMDKDELLAPDDDDQGRYDHLYNVEGDEIHIQLKGKSVEEKYHALKIMKDFYDEDTWDDFTQKELVKYMDCNKEELVENILYQVAKEYDGEKFGITSKTYEFENGG